MTRIPDARLHWSVSADRPDTWARKRPAGQWFAGGGRLNPRRDTDIDDLGLRWVNDTTLVGPFADIDGNIERLQQTTWQGVPVIDTVLQLIDDGSYRYQSGGGINRSVASPPSFPVAWDGARSRLRFIDRPIPTGPGARSIWVANAFVAEPHHWADDLTTHWEVHAAPGQPRSGPLVSVIHKGKLLVGGKHEPTPVPVDRPGNLPTDFRAGEIQLREGEAAAHLWHFLIDPGGRGFVRVWDVTADRADLVVEHGSDFGWITDDPATNALAYPIGCGEYNWLNPAWNRNRPGEINYDPRFPLRHARTLCWAGGFDGDVDFDDMVAHLRDHLPTCSPQPDPQDGLDRLLDELERRVRSGPPPQREAAELVIGYLVDLMGGDGG